MIIRLLNFARPHWLPLSVSLACRVVNQLGTIAILVVAGHYAQQLFDGEQTFLWQQLIWPLLVIGVGKAFCRYIEQLSGHNAAFRIQEDLRNKVYWQLESQAPDNIHLLSTGDLTARVVSDIERIEVFYAHTIIPVLSALIVSAFVTYYGYLLSGSVALILCGLLLVVGLFIPSWHLMRSYTLGSTLRREFGQLNSRLTDIVAGVSEIQNWHAMKFFQQQVSDQGKQLQQYHNQLAKRNGLKDALTDLVIGLGFLGFVLQVWWLEGEVSLPLLCLYAGAFGPVLALTRTFEDLPQTFPACVRVLSMLTKSFDSAKPECNKVKKAEPSNTLLKVDQLRHQYLERSDGLFGDISLELNANQYVIIQGESGSGKTTLLRYLAAIYTSDQGSLSFNGELIDHSNRLAMWQNCCYIPQQTIIFPASLRYNLCLGQEYSDELLVKALQLVCLDPLYLALEQGLDTELGLNGSRVSGGEAQRIALARAWLRDASVYLLDEAFSALDKQTEKEIRHRLESHWKNKLVVEIAHQAEEVSQRCQYWQLQDGKLIC